MKVRTEHKEKRTEASDTEVIKTLTKTYQEYLNNTYLAKHLKMVCSVEFEVRTGLYVCDIEHKIFKRNSNQTYKIIVHVANKQLDTTLGSFVTKNIDLEANVNTIKKNLYNTILQNITDGTSWRIQNKNVEYEHDWAIKFEYTTTAITLFHYLTDCNILKDKFDILVYTDKEFNKEKDEDISIYVLWKTRMGGPVVGNAGIYKKVIENKYIHESGRLNSDIEKKIYHEVMGEILKANYDDDALARAKDHYNHTLCKFEMYCSKMIPSLKITTSHLNQLRHTIKQNDKRLEKIEEPVHKEENKKRIIRNSKGPIPKRHTKGSAAYDIETPYMIVLYPGQLYKVNTGVSVELLEGEAGQLIPRSSMVDNDDYIVSNTFVIDEDYKGEIHIPVKSTKGNFNQFLKELMDVLKDDKTFIVSSKNYEQAIKKILKYYMIHKYHPYIKTSITNDLKEVIERHCVTIPKGTRLVQLMIVEYKKFDNEITPTKERGDKGFGSTN